MSSATAGQYPTAPAKLLANPPTIDGEIKPGEWDQAFYTGLLLDRFTGQLPSDTTDAWIGYDKKYIYVAFYCRDSEPSKIVGREIIPNSSFQGEDTITIDFNTFGTRAFNQLSTFIVNALGTQTERIAGGRTGKREWRGEWIAKTKIVEDGWVCEVAIPWSMLNYPKSAKVNMDLNFIRRQGRTLFQQSWANATPNPLPELQGVWEGIEPPAPPKPKAQYLIYNATEFENESLRNRAGFDARYPLTGAFNALVSYAPDFRNIEDVIAGIDFVRTERFLNETRPFFSEGGGFFRLNEGYGIGTMFYSRRVQAFDVGIKGYGQLSPTLGVGALVTSAFEGQKSGVANIVKNLDATTTANVYAMTNTQNGVTNNAMGLNYNTRKATVGFSATLASEQNEGEKPNTAGSFSLNYQRPTIFATARYLWVDQEFNPALAFIPWTNRRGGYVFANHGREWRKGFWRDYSTSFNFREYRTYDGELQEGGFSVGGSISTRSDLRFSFDRSRFTYFGSTDDTLTLGAGINVSNRFKQFGFNYTAGTQGDQQSRFISTAASYRLQDNLDLSVNQSILDLAETATQTIFTIGYQPANDQLITGRVAITDAGTNAYLSFRKAGLAGAEYYLILGDPNALTTQRRVSLKVVWAF